MYVSTVSVKLFENIIVLNDHHSNIFALSRIIEIPVISCNNIVIVIFVLVTQIVRSEGDPKLIFMQLI